MAESNKTPKDETKAKSGEEEQAVYRPPAVHRPTISKLESIARDLNMDVTEDQLKQYKAYIDGNLDAYEAVYRMVEPKPPVKYPRTPGYRPQPEDNIYNAWYVKTDIKGAATGKLAGRKVAIKDNIAVAGVPMMNGSKLLEGYIPDYDAPVVTRILDEGGHIVGKSVCEHFCFSGNSMTTDLNPVLNPHDKTRSTGGSSSGNGTLVASGEVDMSVGGDQGGSVRIPASWCGIVGFKPTFGLIPYTGAVPLEPTIDHLGPMTRNVRDCALMLEVLAGYDDGMDYRQPDYFPPVPEYSKDLNSDLSGKKIGLLKEGFMNCEPDVVEAVKNAAQKLTKKGAVVEEVSIPQHKDALIIWTPTALEGVYNTVSVSGGYGPSAKGFYDTNVKNHLTKSVKHSVNDLSVTMKGLTLFGKYIQDANNFEFYGRSSNLIRVATAGYEKVLRDYDVLIMPTLPYKAPKLPDKDCTKINLIQEAFGMIQNTAPFNATGHPALSVPAGTRQSLPVGMMIVGKKWREQDVLNVALAHEELTE